VLAASAALWQNPLDTFPLRRPCASLFERHAHRAYASPVNMIGRNWRAIAMQMRKIA